MHAILWVFLPRLNQPPLAAIGNTVKAATEPMDFLKEVRTLHKSQKKNRWMTEVTCRTRIPWDRRSCTTGKLMVKRQMELWICPSATLQLNVARWKMLLREEIFLKDWEMILKVIRDLLHNWHHERLPSLPFQESSYSQWTLKVSMEELCWCSECTSLRLLRFSLPISRRLKYLQAGHFVQLDQQEDCQHFLS